jgi:ADP-heptose:LPS heptosyltransferase
MLSLPYKLHIKEYTDIPFSSGYLSVDSKLANYWQKKVRRRPGRALIGLMWRGSAAGSVDSRSIPLTVLARLMGANADFVSLQLEHADDELRVLNDVGIQLFGREQRDLLDTAAIIVSCDVVVSIDTSIAHLVGALGRKGFILLPYAADWRWHEDDEDSLWYDSLRLFRQKKAGCWDECIDRVVDNINSLSEGSS